MKHLLLSLLISLPLASQAQLIHDSIILDMNQDGGFDNAVLSSPGDGDADLSIYLSRFNEEINQYEMELAFFKPEFIFSGAAWGMQPSLSQNSRGSLLITFGNDAIGRNRWEQTLTVAYRNGTFVVAGFTYTSRDTLDPELGGNCDLNLLTGKGIVNGKTVRVRQQAIALEDWSDELFPEACVF